MKPVVIGLIANSRTVMLASPGAWPRAKPLGKRPVTLLNALRGWPVKNVVQ